MGACSFADSYSLHCKQSYALEQPPLFTGFACLESELTGKSIASQRFPALVNFLNIFACLQSELKIFWISRHTKNDFCGRIVISTVLLVNNCMTTGGKLKWARSEDVPDLLTLTQYMQNIWWSPLKIQVLFNYASMCCFLIMIKILWQWHFFLQGHYERTRLCMKEVFHSEHQVPALVMNKTFNEWSIKYAMLSTYEMQIHFFKVFEVFKSSEGISLISFGNLSQCVGIR